VQVDDFMTRIVRLMLTIGPGRVGGIFMLLLGAALLLCGISITRARRRNAPFNEAFPGERKDLEFRLWGCGLMGLFLGVVILVVAP
jgi:hypothetical protein